MHKLIVVGSGIKSIAHLTEETKYIIQHADKVLYLVNENHLKDWVLRVAAVAESLEPIYFGVDKRVDAYKALSDYIFDQYHSVSVLCVLFYGHPTVFAESALNVVKKIQSIKGKAVILPAVSFMDCLYSDLLIDPGDQGCFVVDATELLLYEKMLDKSAHVIVSQLANLGMYDILKSQKLDVLTDYLQSYYSPTHKVCLYEAAILPTTKPRCEWLLIKELPNAHLSATTTLYIPPASQKTLSEKYTKMLGIELENFQLSFQQHTSAK